MCGQRASRPLTLTESCLLSGLLDHVTRFLLAPHSMKSIGLAVAIGILFLSLMPVCVSRAGAQNTKALLLFGGDDHKTFLDCLKSVDTSEISVCNDVGEFGSDAAENSIWNDVGPFGSDVSSQSPWNDVSNDAPVGRRRSGSWVKLRFDCRQAPSTSDTERQWGFAHVHCLL